MTSSENQNPTSSALVRANDLSRAYGNGVRALDGVSFTLQAGVPVAITGPSGCGKSTLLHLLAGLDTPTGGELVVDDVPLHRAGDTELTHYRRHTVGIVFQFFHLLPTMTALENVLLPHVLQGVNTTPLRERALTLLETMGLADRAHHFPRQLSGGQMQRVAIARALLGEPRLLLADEPTGNLDSAAAARVLELLEEIASQARTTLIVVTHSDDVARLARRQLRMRDGILLPET